MQGFVVHSCIFITQQNQKTHMKTNEENKDGHTKIIWYVCKTQTLVPNRHPPQQNKKKNVKNVKFWLYQRTCKLYPSVQSFCFWVVALVWVFALVQVFLFLFFLFFFSWLSHMFYAMFKDFGLHTVFENLGFTFCCRAFEFLGVTLLQNFWVF